MFNKLINTNADGGSPAAPVITNTVQFNGTSSPSSGLKDVLYKQPTTTSNRRTWTWSGWVKRLSTSNTGFGMIWQASNFSTSAGLDGLINCNWKSTGEFGFYTAVGGGGGQQDAIRTTNQFTDITKYHHIVFILDTTNPTAADRTRIYYDGIRQPVVIETGAGNPPLNNEYDVNLSGEYQMIGQYAYASNYTNSFYGRMALIDFVDGQALEPSNFGGDVPGIGWCPKTYTGSFDTNGYRFYFANSSSLGTDTSGNANNYSTNGLDAGDVNSESVPF